MKRKFVITIDCEQSDTAESLSLDGRDIEDMFELPSGTVMTMQQFNHCWKMAEELGMCDGFGGREYNRLLEDFKKDGLIK